MSVIIRFFITFVEDRGLKRIREESEGLDGDSKKEETKVDPESVPDPESVADWSDESIKEICNSLFLLPEDTTTSVTLNPSEYSTWLYTTWLRVIVSHNIIPSIILLAL